MVWILPVIGLLVDLGTKRPDPQSLGLRISSGKAIVTDKEGVRFLVEIQEESGFHTNKGWTSRSACGVGNGP